MYSQTLTFRPTSVKIGFNNIDLFPLSRTKNEHCTQEFPDGGAENEDYGCGYYTLKSQKGSFVRQQSYTFGLP